MTHPTPWREVIGPIIAQLELAVKMDMDHCLNPKGAEAMARVLSDMARIIDDEIVKRRTEVRND